jgi:23S rRNA (uracil1939-C5)-methyltransferase
MKTLPQKYHPGDLIEIRLDAVAFGGEAVGRLDHLVVFVQGGIDGERVLVEVLQTKKSYLRAKVREVLESSPNRIDPPCPVFGACGGCQYQHINYEHQLMLKETQVREALERIGRLKDFSLMPIKASPHSFGYRSRVDFHLAEEKERMKIGFIGLDGRNIVDMNECPISSPAINTTFQTMRSEIQQGRLEIPRWVEFIKFWDTAEGVKYYFLNPKGQVDLKGDAFITLEVCGKRFKIPPLSFFQVNLEMIPDLVSCVEEFLDLSGHEFLLDAFCGVGLFAILFASKVRFCAGIESDRGAVEYARINAKENQIQNCEFFDRSVEKILKHPERFLKETPDRVILDPTRAGCEVSILESLSNLKVPRIVYVSCNPTTLARDIAFLNGKGYTLEKVQPLDLFPQTKHCEVVASLKRAVS